MTTVRKFMERHYLHFNSREVVAAAKAYEAHIEAGGKMMVTLAGAMSTARIGRILGRLIRKGYVHGICCTGANLEEDVFNLLAANDYRIIEDYRGLRAEDEKALYDQGYNRVTDTCIPEHEAFRRLEKHVLDLWSADDKSGNRRFPHQYFYEMINSGVLKQYYQIDPMDSWMVAAAERNLPIICPGWEDSTLGNIFAGHCITGDCKPQMMKSGIEYMMFLAEWYTNNCGADGIGFFQIGGGIAGDFPICVVPMLHQDLQREHIPFWSYFCQISDSTTSYGSYSGAVPNEKITWGKLDADTPKHIIESDATIVAPLIFAYVLDM